MTVVGAGWFLGYAWLDAASREMRGKPIPLALVVCWKYVDPALCAALMVVSIWGLVPYPDTLGFHLGPDELGLLSVWPNNDWYPSWP